MDSVPEYRCLEVSGGLCGDPDRLQVAVKVKFRGREEAWWLLVDTGAVSIVLPRVISTLYPYWTVGKPVEVKRFRTAPEEMVHLIARDCEILNYKDKNKLVISTVSVLEDEDEYLTMDGLFGWVAGLVSVKVNREKATAEFCWRVEAESVAVGRPRLALMPFDGSEPEPPPELA